jgi:hypothetical protein
MIRIEHNLATGEIIEIPLTPDELADFKFREKEAEILEIETEKRKNELLTKLGISAEEAALLLK